MSKHTPGPWVAVKYPDTKAHTVWANGVSSLASVKHNQPHTQEANAHLIAAAPEMLEALKALIDAFEPYVLDETDADVRERNVAHLIEARAAIRKATGGAE